MSETTFGREIRKECRKRGAYILKVHADEFQEAAVDYYICYRGRFIAVEAKSGTGTAMPHQLRILANVQSAGGYGVVVGHIDTLRKVFTQIDHEMLGC